MDKEYFKQYSKQKWQKIKSSKELYEKSKEYARAYYHQRKHDKKYTDYREDYRKKYRQRAKNNPELSKIIKQRINNWRATPSGIYTSLKNRGRYDFTLSKEEFVEWYNHQSSKCGYCGLTLEQIRKLPYPYNRKNGLIKFSIDRKDNAVGYTLKNIFLCCFTCNTIKNNLLTYEEMQKIGKTILVPKFKNLLESIY